MPMFKADMAASQKPDFDAMVAELDRLEREEREISALRRRLQDRIDTFPTNILPAPERQVSADGAELPPLPDEQRRPRRRQVPGEAPEPPRRIDLLRAEPGLPVVRPESRV